MRKSTTLKKILVLSFCSLAILANGQNVGINTTGATPSTNAILDLNTGNANNLGLIIPSVTLGVSLATFNPPIANAPTAADVGMFVYNSVATNQAIGYYYWNGAVWVSLAGGGGGLTSADNGLSVSGTIVQLGGPIAGPAPLLHNSVISGSNFNLDFDLGSYTSPGTGSFLITNGGLGTPLLSVTSTTPGVGVNINPALSTLDVNGSIATRETSVTISANAQLVTVGNSSYLIMTSTGSICTGAFSFSLSNGQPGQELTLEMSSGNAYLPNAGNVKLAALAAFGPYSTLCLKWDNINNVWVELSRNALTTSAVPSTTYNYTWNGTSNYYNGSVQSVTVPACATTMTVTIAGASGWGADFSNGINTSTSQGGLGAVLTGTVTVTPGDVLDIIVGAQGADPSCCGPLSFYGACGGGGSFIWDATTNTLLVAAGGGGGAGVGSSATVNNTGSAGNGQTSLASAAALETATTDVAATNGAGGVGGLQGTIGTGGGTKGGAGGCGWSASFTTANWANSTAYCPTCGPTPGQGGVGGSGSANNGYGGYGGGGGGAFNAGGGGGGYNGGGGGNGTGGTNGFGGGGGGSFWQNTVPTSSSLNSAASNATGYGYVNITF